MIKKLIPSTIISILLLSTIVKAAATDVPNGSVLINNKAYNLTYANNSANQTEITNAITSNSSSNLYVKSFNGDWIDNCSSNSINESVINVVSYKDETGKVTNYLKRIVADFIISIENIDITNGKVQPTSTLDTNNTLDDKEFSYYVDDSAKTCEISRQNLSDVKVNNKISDAAAKNISEDMLKKITTSFKNCTIDTHESRSSSSGYTTFFKEKNSNGINTGSVAYVDLFLDGQLKALEFYLQDNSICEQKTNISKDQANNIVFKYFSNHDVLKNYISTIQNNNYTLETDVFHGVNVWHFTTTIPGSIYEDFEFGYLIDVNTGEFILQTEPKLQGFGMDADVEKRLDKILSH